MLARRDETAAEPLADPDRDGVADQLPAWPVGSTEVGGLGPAAVEALEFLGLLDAWA